MASGKTTTSTKSKAPAFKPPRPAPKSNTTAKVTSRRKSAPARTPVSVSSSEDEAAMDAIQDSTSTPNNGHSATKDVLPTIPLQLLTKLLHHNFKDGQTRIGKEACAMIEKYMETFVREAIARAAFERNEGEGSRGQGGDFLEVEDLEKLAPQLILDF